MRRRLPSRAGASWALGAVTVGLQICYPLTRGRTRSRLSIATVLAFATTTLTSEAARHGSRGARALAAIAGGGGLAVEVLGVRTGKPFGRYRYSRTLGPQLGGVPAVVPFAWVMMAGPALAATRRLTRNRVAAALVGGVALSSWDVFLDPQMVADGHWAWEATGPALQGIPLSNYAGWFATATAMMGALDRAIPRDLDDDALPLALYLWTYVGSVVAHAIFLRRPGVALSGGVAMGTVALPLAARLAAGSRG